MLERLGWQRRGYELYVTLVEQQPTMRLWRADLAWFAWRVDQSRQATILCDELLEANPSDGAAMRALNVRANILIAAGQYIDAARALEQAIDIARALGDEGRVARYLGTLAVCQVHARSFDTAVSHLETARQAFQRLGDGAGVLLCIVQRTHLDLFHRLEEGTLMAARLEAARTRAETLEAHHLLGHVELLLGYAKLELGEATTATWHAERSAFLLSRKKMRIFWVMPNCCAPGQCEREAITHRRCGSPGRCWRKLENRANRSQQLDALLLLCVASPGSLGNRIAACLHREPLSAWQRRHINMFDEIKPSHESLETLVSQLEGF
ncbi:MAG: tetratricopeptide repeat protein [Pleurocapsa sp. SU_196_0]|nr:tetratricopeptide repeat protein [Pleurocapsa sp. SU_196_0]